MSKISRFGANVAIILRRMDFFKPAFFLTRNLQTFNSYKIQDKYYFMNINFIETLPAPYKVFHSLSEIYSFFRLHGSYQCIGGIKTYSFTLFKLIPLGGIYSQITVLHVNASKLLELCSITRDFIRPADAKEGFGSIYFKIHQEGEMPFLEAISSFSGSRKAKKIKINTFSSAGSSVIISANLAPQAV